MQINLIQDQIVAGRLRIINEVGTGGFGHVYKAWDQQLERTVALKLITLGPDADREFLDRFLREAQISSALLHSNIARTYSYGLLDSVTPYLVLEYVEGRSLEDLLHEKSRLAPAQAIEIAIKVLDALQYAHGEGVVHRDIKPSNIVLSEDFAMIKIIDFGLARRYAVDSTLTKLGFIQGTPQFMSPEQITGGLVDGRADLYAVACMLCLMISGSSPFAGSTDLEYMNGHLNNQPQLSEMPNCVAKPILRGLAKNPEERFATASEFAEELSRLLSGPATSLQSVPSSLENRREHWQKCLLLVAILAMIGSAAVLKFPIFGSTKLSITVPMNAVAGRQKARENKIAAADRLYENHNFVEAAKTYKQLIDESSNDNTGRLHVIKYTVMYTSASFAAAIPLQHWKNDAERAIKLCKRMDSVEVKACERDLHLILAKVYGVEGDRANCIKEFDIACGLSDRYPVADGRSHCPHFFYSDQLHSWSPNDGGKALSHFKSAIKLLRDYGHARGESIFDENVYAHFPTYNVVGKEQFWVDVADELESEAAAKAAYDAVKRLVSAAWIDSKMQRTEKALQLFNRATAIAKKSGWLDLEAYTYNARVGAVRMAVEDELALNMKAYRLVESCKERKSTAVAAYHLANSYADAGHHLEAARFFQIACEIDLESARQIQKQGNMEKAWSYLFKALSVDGPRVCSELRQHGSVRKAVDFARKQEALVEQTKNDLVYRAYIPALDRIKVEYDAVLNGQPSKRIDHAKSR